MRHLAALLILISFPVWAGDVRVIDGDTIVMDGTRYRLAGIDAPEMGQEMGPRAAQWLAEYLEGKELTCVHQGKSYNRVVASCFVTLDMIDLQEIIVRNGWAYDFPRYSRGKYAEAEAEAKAKGLGVHQGDCMKPWDWRREQRR